MPSASNTPLGARKNIEAHYDLGNDFYSAWLDRSMTYSSAVFGEGDTLERAQARKLKLLLDRLELKPAQRLLEIGCGWGSPRRNRRP
jgi:cyclopropane-fatty-acyl-phospholipid synthase